LLATGHGEGETPPGQARALVTANTKLKLMLEQKTQESDKTFWNWWGWEVCSREQQIISQSEVMQQLEHDVLYVSDKPVSEHAFLEDIYEVELTNEWYDGSAESLR
jgi:hypothetical protein